MNKKISISILILITVIISVIVTTVMMDDEKTELTSYSSSEDNQPIDNEKVNMDKVYIRINNKRYEVVLDDNSTALGLVEMLPLELVMNDLNNNEKYAYLDRSLPANTYNPKRIEAGDIMLFGDNCLVVFYKSFDSDYSYSKIGHIDSLPDLGDGDASVIINVEE